jgi:PLD-like domain
VAQSGRGFERARAGSLLDFARDDLIESVRRAGQRAWLASPFLSKSVAKLIAEAAEFSGAADLRFITALGADPVRRGVLSIAGLETLSAAGFELRAVPNLHAKTAMVDSDWGLVGSGNLTVTGLGGLRGDANVELGVVLSRPQVSAAASHFKRWWAGAEPIYDGDLIHYRRWTPKRGSVGAAARERGQVHGAPISTPKGRELSRLSAERASGSAGRTYWLKMLYYDERDLDRWWETMTWVSDVHRQRERDGEPLLRPSYRIGDLLVLYLVGRACPAIAEVKGEPVFDPDRVERDSTRSDANRWGWVTEVRVIHKSESGLDGAPDLNLLGVAPSSVRQHGHIRISADVYVHALRAIEAS